VEQARRVARFAVQNPQALLATNHIIIVIDRVRSPAVSLYSDHGWHPVNDDCIERDSLTVLLVICTFPFMERYASESHWL